MKPAHTIQPLCAALLAAAALPATQAHAQVVDPNPVTVTGQKMPRAEAPRSATCEALARDPSFRAMVAAAGGDPVMGPRVFVPTRLPRNPDYTRPPMAPPGSPLPDLPKSRFGMQAIVFNGDAAIAASDASGSDAGGAADSAADGGLAATGTSPAAASADAASLDAVIDACRGAYTRGGGGAGGSQGTGFIPASSSLSESGAPHGSPEFRAGAANARAAQGRAFRVSRDTTLPMAFALFDQGRYAEALDWFRKAEARLPFEDGGDEATLFIGKIELQGLGAQSNPAEALKWLTRAATGPFNPVTETPAFDPRQPERNTAAGEAAVILANLYRHGFPGIARDPQAAVKWYARANSLGHVPAAKLLGDLYDRGDGVPRDAKKAAAYYLQAATLDYAPAQFALAELLSTGEAGVRQDRRKALAWYGAAAKHDHPGALYALARAYDLGDGVKPDPQLAIGLYKSAALHGSPAAMVAMGTYFYEGKLLPKDDAMARRWFEAGANGGDSDGMFDLAAMLAKGEGGEKDLVHAWLWLEHAAAAGHSTAPAAIAALEKRMTPSEIEESRKLLTEK